MSAQAGRNLLVKIRDGQGTFVTLAGLRTKTLRFNAKIVDITDSDSVEAWQELLPGAGVKSAEISGAGIFHEGPMTQPWRSHVGFHFLARPAPDRHGE